MSNGNGWENGWVAGSLYGPGAEPAAAVAELAGHTEYEHALAIADDGIARALASLARRLTVVAARHVQDGPPAAVPACRRAPPWTLLGMAAALPFTDACFDIAACCVAEADLHAARPALDELVRVLCPGGVLIVADAASRDAGLAALASGEPQVAEPRCYSPAAWCRLLEEHGLTVDTTITTRTVPEQWEGFVPGAALRPARSNELPLPQVRHVPGVSRDAALSRFNWRGTTIRARKP